MFMPTFCGTQYSGRNASHHSGHGAASNEFGGAAAAAAGGLLTASGDCSDACDAGVLAIAFVQNVGMSESHPGGPGCCRVPKKA
jgi:hypothetical protein